MPIERITLSEPKIMTCLTRTNVSKAGTDGPLLIRSVLGGWALWARRGAPTYLHVGLSHHFLATLLFSGEFDEIQRGIK